MKDLRDSIFNYIFKEMKNNKNSYFLTVDQGGHGYEIIKKKFPSRCINVGISEQNTIGVASGMALEGKTVFIYAISSFIYSRAYEQIKLNLCSMNLKVCIISSGPGYCYAPDGPSHYSLDDISIMNALPNMKVYSPFDDTTCKLSIRDFVKSKGPAYIRTDKGMFFGQKNSKLELTKILNGSNHAIITHGYFINLLSKYRTVLKKKNIGLIGLNRIKPLNKKNLLNITKSYKKIIFVDDSWPNASFGLQILNILSGKKSKIELKILSSKDAFFKKGGNRDDIFTMNKIDFSNILKQL